MSYTISLGSFADLASLPAVELAAARRYPTELLPRHIAEVPTPQGVVRRACKQRRLWVARHEDLIVGFVVASFKDDMPYVRQLSVVPELARRGIGSALMREVVGWAKHQNAPYLTLVTFRTLPYNAPFYARLGFEETPAEELGSELREQRRVESRLGIAMEDRIVMRLRLVPAPSR